MSYLYKKIALQLKKEIIDKHIQEGDRMPSIRTLCKEYKCSKNTIEKAYQLLLQEHLIYCKAQSGYYAVTNDINNQQRHVDIYDFSTGNPNMSSFPLVDLKHCLNQSIDAHRDISLDIGLGNIDTLNTILPRYLSKFQVFASSKNIFINLGILQVLTILCEMPFPNHKQKILIEEPTYSFFIRYLKHNNYPVLTIPRNENGIDLVLLKKLFQAGDIKFFYTVPRAHNPLGTSYTNETKNVICALAELYDVYIVEDDYFGDYDVISRNYTLYSYGYKDHHIYLKSFSKLIPWIRIGISVLPDALLDTFHEYANYAYYTSYFAPSLVSQATLEMYLRSNIIDKHTEVLKRQYRKKLLALKRCLCLLEENGIHTIGGECGFYCLIQLPQGISEKRLIEKLEKVHMIVSESDASYYHDNHPISIRISIANVSEKEIEYGFKILLNILKDEKKDY